MMEEYKQLMDGLNRRYDAMILRLEYRVEIIENPDNPLGISSHLRFSHSYIDFENQKCYLYKNKDGEKYHLYEEI